MEKKVWNKICIISLLAIFILIGLDQWTKWLAVTELKPISTMMVIDGFLDFTFVENRGAAFGILTGRRWFFIILTVAVVCGILYSFFNMPKQKEYIWLRAALLLVFSGAIGNVIDRIFRGYVVDFLEITLIKWPVFNLADVYVVTGACVIIFLSLFVIKEEEKK